MTRHRTGHRTGGRRDLAPILQVTGTGAVLVAALGAVAVAMRMLPGCDTPGNGEGPGH